MRKNLSRALLAAALALCLLPTPASALSGVDLSRIKFSSGEKPIYFKFGDLAIEGTVRQQYPFTKEKIEEIAKKTLADEKITQLELTDLNRMVQKARRAASFTQEDMDIVRDNLITTVSVVPKLDNAATLAGSISKFMTSKSWDDIGTVSTDLLVDSMNEKVKETAKGYISETPGEIGAKFVGKVDWVEQLAKIAQFCDMLAEQYGRDKQRWADIAQGAEAKFKLNKFYSALQKNIDAYKEQSNEAGWTIDFDHAMTYRTFAFFGVEGNIQEWYLDMNLRQTATDEYGSMAGTYEGNFTMSAEHDMSAFTAGIDQALPKLKPVKNLLNTLSGSAVKPTFRKVSDGNAYISRTISGICSAEIDKSGQVKLSLSQNNDESNVLFSGISAGIVFKTGTKLDQYVENSLRLDIGNKKENVFVTFQSANTDILVPGQPDQSYSAGGTGGAGWDENIWKPWDGTQKTLSLDR